MQLKGERGVGGCEPCTKNVKNSIWIQTKVKRGFARAGVRSQQEGRAQLYNLVDDPGNSGRKKSHYSEPGL